MLWHNNYKFAIMVTKMQNWIYKKQKFLKAKCLFQNYEISFVPLQGKKKSQQVDTKLWKFSKSWQAYTKLQKLAKLWQVCMDFLTYLTHSLNDNLSMANSKNSKILSENSKRYCSWWSYEILIKCWIMAILKNNFVAFIVSPWMAALSCI